MPVLKEFTKVRKGERFISLHIKYASRLSTELAETIGVKDGDYLHFYKDQVKTDNWYLAVDNISSNGSQIKKRKGRHGYVFYNTAFAKEIKEQFNLKKDFIKIKVGTKTIIDGKPYYPIITAQLF